MRKSKLCFIGGLLLLAAALCLIGYNLWDAHRAGDSVEEILSEMSAAIEMETDSEANVSEEKQEPVSTGEMPEIEIDGQKYIGRLEIPALELVLPVMGEWSDSNLKISPCRYSGSVQSNDLIIAGHNYPAHFGKLNALTAGDEVIFSDADGNIYRYTVSEIEQLSSTALEEMESGGWDLTLFTCTVSGKARVTVRCVRTDEYLAKDKSFHFTD